MAGLGIDLAAMAAEETGLLSAETVTGGLSAIGGVVAVTESFNQAIHTGERGVKRAKAAIDTISTFVTPNAAKPDNRLGNITSKRQKIALAKSGVASRQIDFGSPVQSTGIRRSINVQDPVTQLLRHSEDSPVANNQASAQGASAMASGNDHEVPVAKVPRLIAKIHPDVFNIRLPLYGHFDIKNSEIEAGIPRPLFLIRLNSIYDCFKNAHTQKDYAVNPFPQFPLGAGTAVGTAANANDPVANAANVAVNPYYDTDNGPVGRNVWQGHFKYYRVLRSDIKLTFIHRNCEQSVSGLIVGAPVDAIGCMHNMYSVGYELVDEDAMLCQNHTAFLTAKNVVRDIMLPAPVGLRPAKDAADANYLCQKPSIGVMQYTYKPENWRQHVEQLGNDTRWTAVGSNPSLDHLMAVRAFHLDNLKPQSRGDALNMAVMVQIEFEVQFRECLDDYIKTGYQAPSADT